MIQTIELGIPDQDELLKALGRLAVAHGNLEMVQIMCLKTLKGLSSSQALEEYRRCGAGKIRDQIEKLLNTELPSSEARCKNSVIELLRDARCHGKRRNALIHRFWGKKGNGCWVSSGDENNWDKLPSIDVICDLTASICRTTEQLNKKRFKGGYILKLRTARESAPPR